MSVIKHLDQGGVVVTAHRRLSRSLHNDYCKYRSSQGDSVWITPLILPLDAWFIQLYSTLLSLRTIDVRLLDNEQVVQQWQKLIDDADDQFFLSPSRTATSLAKAWLLRETYQSGVASSDVGGLPFIYQGQDCAYFSALAQTYEQHLLELNAVDRAVLPEFLRREMPRILTEISCAASDGSSDRSETPSAQLLSKIMLAGFAQLTPSVGQLFQCIDEQFPVLVHDTFAANDSTPADLSVLSGRSDHDLEDHGNASLHRAVEPAEARRHEFASAEDEILGVARWCRHKLSVATDDDLPDIVVVVFDLQSRLSQIQRLFDEVFFPGQSPLEILQTGRPYDIGIGYELSDWPLIRSAILALRLALADAGQLTLGGKEFSELLLSHYCLNLPADAPPQVVDAEMKKRMLFDQSLRRTGRHTILLDDLRENENLPELFRRGLARVKPPRQKIMSASAWCNHFSNTLSTFGWPGPGLDSAEHQAFLAWQDVLGNYARAGETVGSHSAQDALTLLQQLLSKRRFQPETQQLPIQIIDPHESIGLRADHIWVTAMDTRNWPGQVSPDAWLPRRWQQVAGVPGACARTVARDAATRWQSWLASATSTVIASFAHERDDQPVAGATLLNTLTPLASGAELDGDDVCRFNRTLFDTLSPEIIELEDCQGPGIDDGATVGGGVRIFEDQAQCPFRAFARHRLIGKSFEEAQHGIDPRQKGNLLHHCMQLFWQQVQDSQSLHKLIAAGTLESVVDNCIESAFQQENDDRGLFHQAELINLEKDRIRQLMLIWLREVEATRSDFTVIATEESRQIDIEQMTFKLQVDRIDALAEGQKAIIDYKTGSNNSSSGWLRERVLNPQLPIYATLEDDVAALAFAQTTRNDTTFKGLAADDDLLPSLKFKPNSSGSRGNRANPVAQAVTDAENWQDLVDFWRDRTGLLAREIKSGHAVVDPQPGACDYCEFRGLCRIDPLQRDRLAQAFEDSSDSNSALNGASE